MSRRRVVITGIGAVSSVGLDLASNWNNLLKGTSGAAPITRFDTSKHACKFACEVAEWNTERFFPKTESKRLDKFTMYYLVAADEAMKSSGLDFASEDRTRAGVITGTGIGGIHEIEASKQLQLERGADRVSPFFIPKIMANAMAGQAAIRFGLMGTCYVTSSACASASHAIGQALRSIQWGEADVMLTGGSEAATTELGLGGFCALKAVSSFRSAGGATARVRNWKISPEKPAPLAPRRLEERWTVIGEPAGSSAGGRSVSRRLEFVVSTAAEILPAAGLESQTASVDSVAGSTDSLKSMLTVADRGTPVAFGAGFEDDTVSDVGGGGVGCTTLKEKSMGWSVPPVAPRIALVRRTRTTSPFTNWLDGWKRTSRADFCW